MKKDNEQQSPDFLIKTAWHSIQRMYSMIARKNGISQAMGFVLISISKDGSTATEIAKSLGVRSISLTRVLQDLNERDFITRSVDKKDKRKVIYKLTNDGVEARKIVAKVITEFNNLLLKKLSSKEIKTLHKIVLTIENTTNQFSLLNDD